MSEEHDQNKSLDYYRKYFYLDSNGDLFIHSDIIYELKNISGCRFKELIDLLCTTNYDREYIKRVVAFSKGNFVASLSRRKFNNIRHLLWDRIVERDGEVCKRCGRTDNLSIDHIKSLKNGGTNDLSNLQILCQTCNSRKGAR